MTSHPDADQFMRVYLRDPTEVTTRLVFADWLEETGERSNVAWAHYIRAKAAAQALPWGSTDRREHEADADRFAPYIRANLTVPAAHFVGYPKSLLQLLPPGNITVRLAGFRVPPALIAVIPEFLAREYLLLALDQQPGLILIAAADPWDRDTIEKLPFILNRGVIAVGGAPDEIRAAIDAAYADLDVDFELVQPIAVFDDPAYRQAGPRTVLEAVAGGVSVNQLVGLILTEARQRGADRVQVSPIGGVGLRYRVDGEWSAPDRLPDRLLHPIAARLARMAGAESQFRHTGRVNGTSVIDGTRFTMRVAIEPLEEGPAIQLDFVEEQATASL
jgi:uncharacterized protein (TIGR02996 family)